ncbi:hypothetical protein J4E93_010480 [Alternaria ventricosa]|uniref:uncharacterized protein n=1 Tax=Alternaria ventricosa TaxID=1187951 RepID=UPI0020C269DD|nr:uncharacterized protein J4E93_010480 [Alternaria ventricosa]KAI4638012.1 hypothetical protein J4E93_010480 [Alternaria ventricosa]
MTTHVANPRGRTSTSFLDLPGELRNTVYQHFIDDLKDQPDSLPPGSTLSQRRRLIQFGWSDGHALNLASIHRQIHAEFMTLYLHQVYHGGSRLVFNDVDYFLDLFFGQSLHSGLKDVSYQFEVRMGAAGDYLEADWSLDLLKVVSIMRHHPLISIAWNLVDSFREATFDDSGVVYAVSALKDMDVQLFGNLNSVMLYLNKSIPPNHFGRTEIEAEMPCMLKKVLTGPSYTVSSVGQSSETNKPLPRNTAMAVNSRDNGGGKSFLDLSGELRNAVYNHFIELDPTVGEATTLAHSSQQIRAEFGSLCLALGNFAIPEEHVDSFLDVFFPHGFECRRQYVHLRFDLSLNPSDSPDWSIDLLKLVSIMHHNYGLLLKISWFKDITTAISVLKNMDVQKLEKVRSVAFEMCGLPLDHPMSFLPRLGAFLFVTMKAFATEEEFHGLGLDHLDGFINVRSTWEYFPFEDTETSENEDGDKDGDEDGSDDEEETSDDGNDDEDGGEDTQETCEDAVEKLRNTFYHHFIDLWPSTSDAANLACVNQQVHAEFTTLYLSRFYQGATGVPFEHVPFFLHFFFAQYPDAVPKNVLYKFNVGLGSPTPKSIDLDASPCWSLDLLKVVSVMREYPLIEVVWDLGAGMGRYSAVSFDDKDIAYAVTNLRCLDAQHYNQLSSVRLTLSESPRELHSFQPFQVGTTLALDARLWIELKNGVTEFCFEDIDTNCGGINVGFGSENSMDSDEQSSDGEEDDLVDGHEDSEGEDQVLPDLGDLIIF